MLHSTESNARIIWNACVLINDKTSNETFIVRIDWALTSFFHRNKNNLFLIEIKSILKLQENTKKFEHEAPLYLCLIPHLE